MTRVACIGEAMIELAMQGAVAQVGVAGDTLNTAIYLKRSAPGLDVDYVTCLGDDPFSEQIGSFIAGAGIGCAAVRRIPGKSPGLYAITTRAGGERSFTYWRSASAARELFQTGTSLDFSMLAAFDWIYLSGISIAILPHPVRLALLDWLQRCSLRLAFDSNYRPRLWESPTVAREVTQAFWQRADLALPSLDDEQALFGQSEAQVIARFEALGTPGALKRGAAGPYALGETVDQAYPSAPRVIDTTAAGDSFNGGYLAAVLSGKPQAEALRAGHDLAVAVVQHRGAIIPEAVTP
jgi:2-dehydro-3-deoxygluconokinase